MCKSEPRTEFCQFGVMFSLEFKVRQTKNPSFSLGNSPQKLKIEAAPMVSEPSNAPASKIITPNRHRNRQLQRSQSKTLFALTPLGPLSGRPPKAPTESVRTMCWTDTVGAAFWRPPKAHFSEFGFQNIPKAPL